MGMKMSGNRINNVLDVIKNSKHRQTSGISSIPLSEHGGNDQVGMTKNLKEAMSTVGRILSIRPLG